MANSGLSGEINNDFGRILSENFFDKKFIDNISAVKFPSGGGIIFGRLVNELQAIFLQRNVVIIVQVIKTDYVFKFAGRNEFQS